MTDTQSPAQLPVLSAARLHLRLPQAEDASDLFQVFSHPDAMRYWSSPPYTEQNQAVALVEQIHQLCQQRSLFQWGVVLGSEKAPGAMIGTCTLASLDFSNGRCEVGFILHPDYWRRGLISEALGALFNHAFDDLQMRRIEADVDPRNQASLATLEKLGFQREGLLRERWLVNGEIQDACFLGLLAREWHGAKTAKGTESE